MSSPPISECKEGAREIKTLRLKIKRYTKPSDGISEDTRDFVKKNLLGDIGIKESAFMQVSDVDVILRFMADSTLTLFKYKQACDFFIYIIIEKYISEPTSLKDIMTKLIGDAEDKSPVTSSTTSSCGNNVSIYLCYRKPSNFSKRMEKIKTLSSTSFEINLNEVQDIFVRLSKLFEEKDMYFNTEYVFNIYLYIMQESALFGDDIKIKKAILYNDIICPIIQGIIAIKKNQEAVKDSFPELIKEMQEKKTSEIPASSITPLFAKEEARLEKETEEIIALVEAFIKAETAAKAAAEAAAEEFEDVEDKNSIITSSGYSTIYDDWFTYLLKITIDHSTFGDESNLTIPEDRKPGNPEWYVSSTDGDCGISSFYQIYTRKNHADRDNTDYNGFLTFTRELLSRLYNIMAKRPEIRNRFVQSYSKATKTITNIPTNYDGTPRSGNNTSGQYTFEEYADFIRKPGSYLLDTDIELLIYIMTSSNNPIKFAMISKLDKTYGINNYNYISGTDVTEPLYVFYNIGGNHFILKKCDTYPKRDRYKDCESAVAILTQLYKDIELRAPEDSGVGAGSPAGGDDW